MTQQTPSDAWSQYLESRNAPQALREMLEIVHAFTQDQSTNATPDGRRALYAMNAARVALSILDEEQRAHH